MELELYPPRQWLRVGGDSPSDFVRRLREATAIVLKVIRTDSMHGQTQSRLIP